MDAPEHDDPFAPPDEPCECFCLHCQRVVMSSDIWYQRVVGAPDGPTGFWMCPTPNCSGAGFTFDLHPTDPNHPANSDWECDDEDEPEFDPVYEEAEYDPAEPGYPSDDGPDDPDALDGEEWKLGLQPGERPPEPPEVAAAREAYEAEQRQYDEPDRRPRTIDGSHWRSRRHEPPGADAITEDDIPF